MKNRSFALFFLFLFFLLLAGCSETNFTSGLTGTEPPPPAEEILINNEQFNKPYKILGPVEYTLTKRASLFSSQLDYREQAIDLLKQQTYAKYGDEVDAIIDTRVEEKTEQDIGGKLNITHIEGVAISFLTNNQNAAHEKRPAKDRDKDKEPAAKRKTKSPKKILVFKKTKPQKRVAEKPVIEKQSKKAKEEEIEISPTEILK